MDILHQVGLGFSVTLTLENLLLCFIGVSFGTLIGVLPGLGPAASLSLLLPLTFKMSPVGGVIMLAGILYGAQYGGSTTSILVNIPGEASSVVTCFDGYEMAKQGRAGPALGIAAFGSFIAGTLSIFGIVLVSSPLAKLALQFGPPEYFSMILLGMLLLIYLSRGSIIKALMMGAFGFLLSTIGQEVITGKARFTMGFFELYNGLGIVPVIMGLYGITEVLINLETKFVEHQIVEKKIKGLLPTRQDWGVSIPAILRGTIIGFFMGCLPGGGKIISTFASYAIEKKLSRYPERFGKGAIEGVAGPEAANNASAQASFIPMLTLGLPTAATLAILMGALMIHNIIPGPLLMKEHPDLFWGVICSMYVGNVMLLVLNLPLIGIWVKVLKIPYSILFPLILLICLIGVYSVNGYVLDMIVMILFGIMGYLMKKFKYESTPIVLGMILGEVLEPCLRRSLIISSGSFKIFFNRPISLAFMIATAILLISPFILKIIGKVRRA